MVCEGEGKQGGACRDDYVLPAVKLVGDRCGVDGGAQLHVPQIASRLTLPDWSDTFLLMADLLRPLGGAGALRGSPGW